MGFALTVVYLVIYYLTPTAIFGPLAPYRIELIVAVFAVIVSVPALTKSFIFRTPQSLALVGLGLAVVFSVLIGMHWAGGAVQAFLGFAPNAFAYFLICLHCNSKRKIQVLVLMLLFVCLFIISQGYIDLLRGVPSNAPITTGATLSPYLLAQKSDAGDWIFRLRGLGDINDPNDFAQVIVCLIPLMFIFWRKKKMLFNFVFVIVPVSALLFGAFLTHSRGAVVALLAVLVVAARRRIGTLFSLILAGGLFVAASVLNFTGGRDISADAGASRVSLWGAGLQLLKMHPLFGVGFANMADEAGLTAHNSIVVCAAELGMFGLFFWSMFLFPTVRNALTIASPEKVSDGQPIADEVGLYPGSAKKLVQIDKEEINRLGRLVFLSLCGFLVAGWFLSRAFVMTLFMLGAMAEVVFEMALQRGMVAPRMRLTRVLAYSGGLAIALVLVMYFMVLVLNRVK
jgi:hypothetical protein